MVFQLIVALLLVTPLTLMLLISGGVVSLAAGWAELEVEVDFCEDELEDEEDDDELPEDEGAGVEDEGVVKV